MVWLNIETVPTWSKTGFKLKKFRDFSSIEQQVTDTATVSNVVIQIATDDRVQ